MKTGLVILLAIVSLLSCTNDIPTKPQPDKPIITNYDTLYVAGEFNYIDSLQVNNIALWDGENWHKVGNGLPNASVSCMTLYKNELYVGVDIDSEHVNKIVKWDGQHWSALGGGMDGVVRDIVVYKDELYVCGWFMNAGGKPVNNIARWNGTDWLPLDEGLNDEVYTMAVYNNELYVGGWFVKSGTPTNKFTANKIAKWNGEKWSRVLDITKGVGGGGWVDKLYVYNDELIILGLFDSINGVQVNKIALWNGSSWKPMGNIHHQEKDTYYSFSAVKYNEALYIGGNFDSIDSVYSNYYAKWNNTKWMPSPFTTDAPPGTFFVYNNFLYVGGHFNFANNINANGIFKWDGNEISKLKNGVKGYVYAIEAYKNKN